jgi:hypothetical protein
MTSLITVFFLTAMQFSPTGDVQEAGMLGAHRTAAACEAARLTIINEPPVGLPPQVGLACVEVQFVVRNA